MISFIFKFFFCSKEIPFVHTSKKLWKLNWVTEASRTINTTGNEAPECRLPSIIHMSLESQLTLEGPGYEDLEIESWLTQNLHFVSSSETEF